jgi:hypothetical protein
MLKDTEEHRLNSFENRVLRRMFGSKWVELTEGWTTLCNLELNNLHSSQNIVNNIKSRRIKYGWAMLQPWGRKQMHNKSLLESLKGREHSDNLGIDWRTILKLIL